MPSFLATSGGGGVGVGLPPTGIRSCAFGAGMPMRAGGLAATNRVRFLARSAIYYYYYYYYYYDYDYYNYYYYGDYYDYYYYCDY